MKTPLPLSLTVVLLTLVSPWALSSASAGSATWNLTPATGDWNVSVNWTPATVPNGPADIATFASSNLTDVFCSADTEVNSIVFDSAASSFTITPNPGTTLTISGAGIVNNSAATQNFAVGVDSSFNHAFLIFSNSATAGNMTTYTAHAATVSTYGGTIDFIDAANCGSATFLTEGGTVSNSEIVGGSTVLTGSASASSATFITEGGTVEGSNGGEVAILDQATGASANFTNNPGMAAGAQGGFVEVEYDATLGDAISINNGATTPNGLGGVTAFYDTAHAGNSTLIANGGSNGGGGGQIIFFKDSFGDFARVQLFGDGFLDCFNHGPPGVTIGSLEGDGFVIMGPAPLIIGSNNLSTVFAGRITDSPIIGGGAVVKIGSATLVLAGASDYTGRTTVQQGKLEVRNRRGSATGTGPVNVRKGQLTGSGIIAGDVTIGTRSGGSLAILSPGRKPVSPQTLTIQSSLSFEADGTYLCDLNSNTAQADQVVAGGVTVTAGAQISLADPGSVSLPPGTAFTVLDNTSSSAISGTFANLPDDVIVSVGGNNYQANYEGGDGNDLTLTVVP
jgi:autotransporter-associated beta strand protein